MSSKKDRNNTGAYGGDINSLMRSTMTSVGLANNLLQLGDLPVMIMVGNEVVGSDEGRYWMADTFVRITAKPVWIKEKLAIGEEDIWDEVKDDIYVDLLDSGMSVKEVRNMPNKEFDAKASKKISELRKSGEIKDVALIYVEA